MAKKGDGGGWLILGIAAVGLLYYTQAGRGEENDAA